MMNKIGSPTSAPSAAPAAAPQTNQSTPIQQETPNPFSDETLFSNAEKGSKQHAAQKLEHQKLEGSIRQAKIHGELKQKQTKPTQARERSNADLTEMKYQDNYFEDADRLKAPRDVKPLRIQRLHKGGIRSISEADESAITDRAKGAGRLVLVSKGKPDRPMTVTVHGINADPDAVGALSKRAAKAGDTVKSFAYDDNNRRLRQSANDLANDLGKWLKQNPGKPLRIDAHSMGGRIALAAVETLHRKGLLQGHRVELNLVATPINGIGAADLAGFAVPPFTEIKNVKPGMDMGANSAFQRSLNDITLPPNVKVRVFTGGQDDVVERNADFEALSKKLGAERVHFPNADHDTTVDAAAHWLSGDHRDAKRR